MNRLLITLSLLAAVPAVQAGELGRLFNTPQQRQQMEFQEANDIEDNGGSSSTPNYIIVNGVVQKQGGNRVIWVNGAAQAAERGNDKTPASVSVTVPGKSAPQHVKVGQKILLEQPPEQPGE